MAALLVNGESGWQLDTSLDVRVFAFAALVALASAVLIGLVPALQATAGNVNDHIKDGQHARPLAQRRRILPRCLLASEVALALVLVIGAGLLATSLARLYQSGVGFDPRGLVNIAFSMDKQQLEGDALMRQYQQLGEGLSRQPGVKSVSFQFIVPLSHRGWNGRYAAPGGTAPTYLYEQRGSGLFRDHAHSALSGQGIHLDRHQGLRAEDDPQPVRGEAAFSRPGSAGAAGDRWQERTQYEVVAVVGDTKYRDMRAPAPPAGYVPIMQDEQKKPSLHCRSAGRWAAGSRWLRLRVRWRRGWCPPSLRRH